MTHPILFGTACVGLVLVTIAWFVLLFLPKRAPLPVLLGPAGTLCASLPILGAWMPETFQPLWLVIQATCLFWLLSFVLIALGLVFAFTLGASRRQRLASAVYGGLGLLFNAAALLIFLWDATVSAGGV
ncbi:MAG: hypothetical protein ACE37H_11560 [Phycisphaeraceae bacterium]